MLRLIVFTKTDDSTRQSYGGASEAPQTKCGDSRGGGQGAGHLRKRKDQKGQLRHGIQNKRCVPVQGEELLGKGVYPQELPYVYFGGFSISNRPTDPIEEVKWSLKRSSGIKVPCNKCLKVSVFFSNPSI